MDISFFGPCLFGILSLKRSSILEQGALPIYISFGGTKNEGHEE